MYVIMFIAVCDFLYVSFDVFFVIVIQVCRSLRNYIFKGRYLQFIYPDRSNRAFSHALSIVFNGDTPKHELANSSLRIDILTCKLKTRGALVRPTSKIYAQFIMNL